MTEPLPTEVVDIERLLLNRAIDEHRFDPLTRCCVRCGQELKLIVDRRLGCHAPENLLAVTHLIHRRLAQEVLEASYRNPQDVA